MSELAQDPRIRHRRTHDLLRRDITVDPIFLFQHRRIMWHTDTNTDYKWDSESEIWTDEDGDEVTEEAAIEGGAGTPYWDTDNVFLTREDGEAYGHACAYNYPRGWRVYCVVALGDLAVVLAEATVEGRYR